MNCSVFLALALAFNGNEKPVEVIDFGPDTVGGYAVFEVSDFSPAKDGTLPVLRVSYATHPDGLTETGDFTRETQIQYLHVDNPVLPANNGRHELYTIPRKGRYVAPLLQGQERYARLQLDTPGTAVTLKSFEIVNAGVHSEAPVKGSYRDSDPRHQRVWDISARTCQMASFPNVDAWKVVRGVLLPRKLERDNGIGWCRFAPAKPGTLVVEYEFRRNPRVPAPSFTILSGMVDAEPDRREVVQKGVDGEICKVTVPVKPGRFGFEVKKEMWPMIHSVAYLDETGKEVWRDDFDDGNPLGKAVNWIYTETLPYMADGGKRDRLVWSGDLWWAVGTVGYAFGHDDEYFPGSLRIMAFNQTPEGFCQAAPYAENRVRPRAQEWGLFASDEFSMWLVPSAWQWVLYSGDCAFAREIWPAVDKELRYVASNLGPDGIFVQKFITSKCVNNMSCGDTYPRLFINLVAWAGWRDGAKLARLVGETRRAGELEEMANRHAAAIRRRFEAAEKPSGWNVHVESKAYQIKSMLSGLLALEFVTPDEAKKIALDLGDAGSGKFRSMYARGLLAYGFTDAGLRQIADGGWYGLSDPSWKGAHTTTECMYMTTTGFWDESHPDTAVADVYSAYILGVRPIEPGFRRFLIAPQPTKSLSFAEGTVPTRHGPITARWDRQDNTLKLAFTVPAGTEAEVFGRTYAAGTYEISKELPESALEDPLPVPIARVDGLEFRTFKGLMTQSFTAPELVYRMPFILDAPAALEKIVIHGIVQFPDSIAVEARGQNGEFHRLAERSGLKGLPVAKPLEIDLRTAGTPVVASELRLVISGHRRTTPSRFRSDFSSVEVGYRK